MTKYQEYLSNDMDFETIEYCKKEAESLQACQPWTEEDTANHAYYHGYKSWLDLVLDTVRYNQALSRRESPLD